MSHARPFPEPLRRPPGRQPGWPSSEGSQAGLRPPSVGSAVPPAEGELGADGGFGAGARMPPRLGAGSGSDGTPPLRRFRASPRRRPARWLVWMHRVGLPLVALAVPAALGLWLLGSPRFALSDLEIRTADEPRVAASWVRESLAPLAGRNLLLLPLAEVEEKLASHPWVEGVVMVKELPDRLHVEVEERRPRALVPWHGRLWWADGEGFLIAPLQAEEGSPELPLVWDPVLAAAPLPGEAGSAPGSPESFGAPAAASAPSPVTETGGAETDGEETEGSGGKGETERVRSRYLPTALATLAEVAEAVPAWAAELDRMVILGEEDFEIATAALPFPVRVRPGTAGTASRELGQLLPELVERYGSSIEAVDLRYSRRIVLQGVIGEG